MVLPSSDGPPCHKGKELAAAESSFGFVSSYFLQTSLLFHEAFVFSLSYLHFCSCMSTVDPFVINNVTKDGVVYSHPLFSSLYVFFLLLFAWCSLRHSPFFPKLLLLSC